MRGETLMVTTGWVGEEPDGGPGLPVTEMLLARREHRAGPLETALARSRAAEIREAREEAAAAPDPDERAAGLVARGYSPGLASQLAQRLGDTMAEIEAEQEKIEKSARRQERIARDHAAGKISAFDIARMQASNDEGDPAAVERLQRRADSLRRQIGQAQAVIAPPAQRDLDPVEAAASRAHRAFVETTRALWAEAQTGAARQAPRPFAGGVAVRGEMCPECAAIGASAAESFLIHSDPAPETVPADFDSGQLAEYPSQLNDWDTEHRRAAVGAGREITRLTTIDGMGQVGTLTGVAVR
jgi:hypothetical protein